MFLLDTNIVSELRKQRPHGAVLVWVNATPRAFLHLSAISIMELQDGALATRKQDAKKADEIDTWIDDIEQTFDILPLDGKAARLTSRLMRGNSAELHEDAMIAAIAIVNGMTVATRNVRDFRRFNVPVENPFHYKG